MDFREAGASDGATVCERAVPLVLIEMISGIYVRKTFHESVARDFSDDGSKCNGGNGFVAANERLLCPNGGDLETGV